MRTRQLYSGRHWTVKAIATDRDDPASVGDPQCALMDFLNGLEGPLEASAGHFLNIVERVAEHPEGPKYLGTDNCHSITDATLPDGRTIKIWQITAKRIRVLFFYDKGHVVICTHGFIKKSGATPKAEKLNAISACKDYFTILLTDGSQ